MLGAASWAIVPSISGVFEPVDSELAFYSGQAMLSLSAFALGLYWGELSLLAYLFGVYLSINGYPYILGSSESRAWMMWEILATFMPCVYPFFAGMLGVLVQKVRLSFRLLKEYKRT